MASSTDTVGPGSSIEPGPLAGSLTNRRSAALSHRVTTWGPLVFLLLLCLGFAIGANGFLDADNLKGVLDQSAVPMVVAVGLTFVILQGSIDLSVEGITAVCAVIASSLIANTVNGNDLGWLAVVVALVVATAFGATNGILYTRLRLPSLMVTLGMWSVGLGVAALMSPGRSSQIADTNFLSIALGDHLGISNAFWIALAVVIVAYLVQHYTRFGRYSYAIGGGEEIARLSGINLRRYKVAAFAIAGLAFGIASMLAMARSGYGSASVGSGTLFSGVAAVVIGGTLLSGGRGGVFHSVVGVLILAVLANGMILSGIDPAIQNVVEGVLTVLAVGASTWLLRSRMRVVK